MDITLDNHGFRTNEVASTVQMIARSAGGHDDWEARGESLRYPIDRHTWNGLLSGAVADPHRDFSAALSSWQTQNPTGFQRLASIIGPKDLHGA
jgi:hypothetical protein